MTQEDKELLFSLLKKANEKSLIHVYNHNENIYDIICIYLDPVFQDSKICIMIK